MHGADKGILWLHRDFSIYVCNMFDTRQASRVLKMERNSLEHLLLYFCAVIANKEYALFQWRDLVARGNDESTGYVLPNKTLIKIAKTMPSTIEELFRVLKNRYPLIDHHWGAVTNIIQKAKANAKAFEEVAARLKHERLEMH
nr:protein RRP6-like 2 [Tanacetum cinerariifolium]